MSGTRRNEIREHVTAAIVDRHCKRAFLDRPVAREVLAHVLTAAAHAPSTRNGQPWRVDVVSGAALQALVHRLCQVFDRGDPPRPDYPNRLPADPVLTERAAEAGIGVLRALGINRTDTEARREHLRRNMAFYGAPVAMVCHLPAAAVPGTFLEMGFFLQNVMLGLVGCGLGSCPQYSVAGYPDVLRAQLGLGDDRLVVCTLAVGHPDPAALVNSFAPGRAALHEYTRWHDGTTDDGTTDDGTTDDGTTDDGTGAALTGATTTLGL